MAHSLTYRQILPLIFSVAGQEQHVLKRCLLLGCLTAVLRGFIFLGFIPLFYAVAGHNLHDALISAGVMSALAVLAAFSDWFSHDYDYNGHAGHATDRLRRDLGQHLRRIPLQQLYRRRSGELNATIAGNVDDVINYTMFIALMLMQAVLTPVIVGLGALYYDWRLGVALLILFPAIVPVYWWARPRMQRHKAEQAEAYSRLSAETVEYTQGLPVLKAACCVNDRRSTFNRAVQDVEQGQIHAMRAETAPNLLLASGVEIGLLLVVALGLWQVSNGDIALMLVAALMVAVIRFAEPLSMLISMMNVVELMLTGYTRLQALYDIRPLPQQQPSRTPNDYSIAFQQLSFCYDGQSCPALNDINLNIPARALTALVGASGCGKTTLIRMLMRYADPQHGSVSIGGIDLRHIEPDTLNRLIAVVFQDVYLFDDTILANIRIGRPEADEADIIAAARAAQCHDFIERLPDGYYTRVGDIGNNLSGGEKQRISIARALLKDAPIIILDEPTAALDTYSELAVQRAIDTLVADKTVIVIAHRLSTIVAAKQIVVLDDGHIIEQGSHQALLARQGKYAALWQAQQYQHRTIQA